MENSSWRELIADADDWVFEGGKLYHPAYDKAQVPQKQKKLAHFVASKCYAVTRTNFKSRTALERLLKTLDDDSNWGLNVGSANTQLHPSIVNLDLYDAPNVNVIGDGRQIPFKDNAFDLIVAREVLEHVRDPFSLIKEIHRLLKPGGCFYCQVPFIIGYHPGPTDFWRFTKEAFHFLFHEEQWEMQELDISLGHGSGCYRVLVEFIAVCMSALHPQLYFPAKGAASVLLYPMQWFDGLTERSAQKHRIPGGYYCIVKKK